MDGDGTIAQKGRKIALEMCSKKIVKDFQNFLKKYNIITKLKKIKVEERKSEYGLKDSYRIIIKSPFYNQYASLIGFKHPRKQLWLLKYLNKESFYTQNIVNYKSYLLKSNIIDYTKILDKDNIFVVNGKGILKKNKLKIKKRVFQNVKFLIIYNELKKKNKNKFKILKKLSNYRFKMSKGSTNSIKLPFYFNEEIENIANFVRLRNGSIGLSEKYIKAFNVNPKRIIKSLENIFDIRAKYTCKKEPIFCSGVLELFFSKIITKDLKEYKLREWYEDLKC